MAGTTAEGVAGEPLLAVEDLSVRYPGAAGRPAVDRVSFTVGRGEAFGLIGQSGSGKSTVCRAVAGLSPPGVAVDAVGLAFDGVDLTVMSAAERRALRGRRIAMVPQASMTALSPTTTIGRQLRWYFGDRLASSELRETLRSIGMEAVFDRLDALPSELSGGQRQRLVVTIAALAHRPSLLVADEPTTNLDVSAQGQVLDLLGRLRARLGLSLLYVTHDLAVVAGLCDRVGVMYQGRLVEVGPVAALLAGPRHPHSRRLVAAARAMPRPVALAASRTAATPAAPEGGPPLPPSALSPPALSPPAPPPSALSPPPLLVVDGLTKRFGRPGPGGRPEVVAVDGVSLSMAGGEIVALVGESGSGKTTLARLLVGLVEPTGGTVEVAGRRLGAARTAEDRRLVQLVTQDPRSALNRRYRVGRALEQAVAVHHLAGSADDRRSMVRRSVARVGLTTEHLDRRPRALSGGELARVVLARALLVSPKLLVLDEVTASLDTETKTVVLDVLCDLRDDLDLALLVVTHELDVARRVADRVAVLQAGRIVESGAAARVFSSPTHPATRRLVADAAGPAARSRAAEG
ncbi:MAG TPA: ABC transporter ATP-binding protein [Acidimicrobiales bacterium]|nr:ABC transporter ATP-binding protein [Acidimicrobiales bacterium]